jgi:hypothetical protein
MSVIDATRRPPRTCRAVACPTASTRKKRASARARLHLRRKRPSLSHGPKLSRLGASGKAGAIQLAGKAGAIQVLPSSSVPPDPQACRRGRHSNHLRCSGAQACIAFGKDKRYAAAAQSNICSADSTESRFAVTQRECRSTLHVQFNRSERESYYATERQVKLRRHSVATTPRVVSSQFTLITAAATAKG